ncbi:MAG TPA: uroporphyrinogen-III synthase [Acidimicrobiales bacterium]|nr:uroporphyrinogen-III synthase [Acidimicrobiales bacterium]
MTFTVGITADRRWDEQARLFADRGVETVHGPTMKTIDLSGDQALRTVTSALAEQPPDYLIVTTGMGMRRWLEAAARWGLDTPLLAGLAAGTRVVARGAKANSAARGANLPVWWRAPEETMQEIVDHLAGFDDVAQSRVALQLFDPDGHPSTEILRAMAGELVEVPVYQWALPDDAGPASRLVDAAIAGALDAVTFTAQPAVHNLFRIAGERGHALRDAFNSGVVASCVGPVCASAATEEGVEAPIWPDPPRLSAMVRQVTSRLTDS